MHDGKNNSEASSQSHKGSKTMSIHQSDLYVADVEMIDERRNACKGEEAASFRRPSSSFRVSGSFAEPS